MTTIFVVVVEVVVEAEAFYAEELAVVEGSVEGPAVELMAVMVGVDVALQCSLVMILELSLPMGYCSHHQVSDFSRFFSGESWLETYFPWLLVKTNKQTKIKQNSRRDKRCESYLSLALSLLYSLSLWEDRQEGGV